MKCKISSSVLPHSIETPFILPARAVQSSLILVGAGMICIPVLRLHLTKCTYRYVQFSEQKVNVLCFILRQVIRLCHGSVLNALYVYFQIPKRTICKPLRGVVKDVNYRIKSCLLICIIIPSLNQIKKKLILKAKKNWPGK